MADPSGSMPGGQDVTSRSDVSSRPATSDAAVPQPPPVLDHQPQAVRFSSVNQEIEPERSLEPVTSLEPVSTLNTEGTSSDAQQGLSPEAEEELRTLSQTMMSSGLQKRRMSQFAFEPVSLPVSRVHTNESNRSNALADALHARGASPRPSPPLTSMHTPPLTPALSQSQDPKADASGASGAPLAKIHPEPAIVTPQISPPAASDQATLLKPYGQENELPSSEASSLPSSSSDHVFTQPASTSSASSVVSAHPKQIPHFSVGPAADSVPVSRETSPVVTPGSNSGSGVSTPVLKPFTPIGDKDDPYARSKRPPQSRNLDAIDPRFIFGGKDSKRSSSSLSSQARPGPGESKNSEEKRNSHIFGSKKDLGLDEGSSGHGHKHGSMSDLKRFFRLGHKSKRSQSPAASLKSNKSGTRTPPHQLPQPTVPFADDHGLTSRYGKFGKVLGSGAGGSVRLMKRSSDGVTFAVKEFRARHAYETEKDYAKKVTAEFCVGSTLHHGNIIETLDIVHEKGRWYEVMEYAPFDLFAIVMTGKMSREEVTCSFLQIVNGVTYLHGMGLAHRDLKLDNVVVNDHGIMKLIDFGSATVFQYPFENDIVYAHGIVGSDPYLAPEVYDNAKYDPQPTDVWSLAIIFCCMSLRRFPWKLPRLTDNSYKLFLSPPTPGQPTGEVKRVAPRPKSTTNVPAEGNPADGLGPPSRAPSGESGPPDDGAGGEDHRHRQHHHHHHHDNRGIESAPVSHAEDGGVPESATTTVTRTSGGTASQPAPVVIKGPWRLLRLLPRESRNIIGRMLEVNPKKRATLQDMHSDPWISGTLVCRQEEGGKVFNVGGHTHSLDAEAEVAKTPVTSKN